MDEKCLAQNLACRKYWINVSYFTTMKRYISISIYPWLSILLIISFFFSNFFRERFHYVAQAGISFFKIPFSGLFVLVSVFAVMEISLVCQVILASPFIFKSELRILCEEACWPVGLSVSGTGRTYHLSSREPRKERGWTLLFSTETFS